MKLPPLPLVVLDTETTGFVPRVHRVIEFACAQARDGKVMEEYEQLFACKEVPPHVETLTRIKTPMLKGQPAFAEKRGEILSHLPADALIVGQNIGFDLGMLKGENLDLTDRPWIDTSMLASLVFPELESYSLGYLSTVLQLDHTPKHRALGDVRATLALLGKCWERLCELPEDLRKTTLEIAVRGNSGYRMPFEVLPKTKKKERPGWLLHFTSGTLTRPSGTLPRLPAVAVAQAGRGGNKEVFLKKENKTYTSPSPVGEGLGMGEGKAPAELRLQEEPLDPAFLESVLNEESDGLRLIAVKNLRTTLRRLPPRLTLGVIHPPATLLEPQAKSTFMSQDTFTADEMTLALKLAWYPARMHDDIPIHGGEEAVWNGKLAATDGAEVYRAQFAEPAKTYLLDHRELLRFLETPEHPAWNVLQKNPSIIVDDASMLEDTATRAYGWYVPFDDLRAGAEGNPLLTHVLDTLQLWIEKTRQFQDIRMLADGDLRSADTRGVREQLEKILEKDSGESDESDDTDEKEKKSSASSDSSDSSASSLNPQIRHKLGQLQKILDPQNLNHRLAWIEQKPSGSQILHSVPERIGHFLSAQLFGKYLVTLLIPQHSADMLPEILPPSIAPRKLSTIQPFNHIAISCEQGFTIDTILANPPTGKTILLLSGKGIIEDMFVKFAEELEDRGVAFICQGLSGGQGRMQAEFLASPAPALWLLTPWMFEGIELPPASVDHLYLATLPFDHPSHPALSRRALHYRDSFGDYCLPRLMHRLFRILRTFSRFKRDGGDVHLTDNRLYSKAYGQKVRDYLGQFSATPLDVTMMEAKPATKSAPKKAKMEKKKEEPKQMKLF